MIVVFIPALLLEIFTSYFIFKAITLKLPIHAAICIDFFFWNMFLVVPSIAAIYMGAVTKSQGTRLSNQIEKYSNSCEDDANLLRVWTFVRGGRKSEMNFSIPVECAEPKVTQSTDSSVLWILQHRLAVGTLNIWNHHHLYGYHMSVRTGHLIKIILFA